MTRNEANWDRAARDLLGLAVLSTVFVGPPTMWGLVGVVPLATFLLGYWPLYPLVGLSTCPVPRPRA